ncbi:MAG: hypothetical protein ACYTGG_00875 [Planctomycetota bacterium]|jgi:hypothetical protein
MRRAAGTIVLVPLIGAMNGGFGPHAHAHPGPPVPPVQVFVDMDPLAPGRQYAVAVTAGTNTVHGVAVYVIDPIGARTLWSIGYLGGLDRGIAFGHMPSNSNDGAVIAMTGSPGTPVHPLNTGNVVHPPYFDPGFVGPEVQYTEWGADGPAVIASEPRGPIFTVDITLDGALPGDRFEFFLLDFVAVWESGEVAGAFSTRGPLTLDAGGDAAPDETRTIYGVDPDSAIPSPPAPFLVDYQDGPSSGGPALIEVIAAPGDLNGDGIVDVIDLLALLGWWGPCPAPPADCPADLTGDGAVTVDDLLALLAGWS